MWDVIFWKNENAIDFVPSLWANEDNTEYKYPIALSETKVREAIYNCTNLEDNFKWCGAVLKKQNIKSLLRAKAFCEKGLYTSNLDTSDEENIVRKKTKRLIEEYDNSNKKSISYKNQEDDDSEDSAVELRKKFDVPCFKKTQFNVTRAETCSVSSRESTPSIASSSTHGQSNLPMGLLQSILKSQAEIKFEIVEIRKAIDHIENRQISSASNSQTMHEDSVFITKLPVHSVPEMDELDTLLQTEKVFNELLDILYLVGGASMTGMINCIMKKVVDYEVAVKYSGVGKKHKLPFCGLRVYKVILGAVRKRYNFATDHQIQKAVAIYLAQSKARLNRKSMDMGTTKEKHSDGEES